MAGTLKIGLSGGKGIGGSIGTANVNLLTELEVARSGFSYQTSDELMWTNFDLVSTLADASFKYSIFKLDQLKEFARNYISDITNSDPVYLIWVTDGENNRHSIVYDLSYEIRAEENLSPLLGNNAAKVRLSVQHNPYWEADGSVTFAGTVNTLGGTINMNVGSISYPSRIQYMNVDGYNDEFANHLTKAWIGIRDKRNGLGGFISKWETEYGSLGTDASFGTSSAASNGTTTNITFATTAMNKRITVQWGNVATANYDDICGSYLVLGRIKLSAGTVEVVTELRHGWLGFAGLESSVGVNYISAVTDANLVNYNLIPLGIVDIPPTGDRSAIASQTASIMSSYGLSLYAERLSAGGSMSVDCFVLIPNDHLLVLGSADINHFTGRSVRAFTGDDDFSYAINRSQSLGFGNIEYSFENWNYPMAGGALVVAAQSGSIHQLGGSVDISGYIFPRYRSYQGSV